MYIYYTVYTHFVVYTSTFLFGIMVGIYQAVLEFRDHPSNRVGSVWFIQLLPRD